MAIKDTAEKNQLALLISILLMYILYQLAYLPHILFQNQVNYINETYIINITYTIQI